MQTPRIDLFAAIHKMLRVSIFDTATLIARADFSSPVERDTVRLKCAETISFLAEHHRHEDSHVMPALKPVAADLAVRVEAEHASLDQHLGAIEALASQLESVDTRSALVLGAKLHREFSVFVGSYLSHMATEDVQLNAALWTHHTDEQLMAIRDKIQGSIPPARFAAWFACMIPAMNLQERIGILSGIKANAPAEAFEVLGGVAREALGHEGWKKVESSLPA